MFALAQSHFSFALATFLVPLGGLQDVSVGRSSDQIWVCMNPPFPRWLMSRYDRVL